MRIIRLLILVLLVSCTSTSSQNNTTNDSLKSKKTNESKDDELTPLKVLPHDDSKDNPEIKAFVDNLINAINKKDTTFIFSAISPKVELSYQDGDDINNINHLKKMCQNDSVLNDFLYELQRSISLGLIKSENYYDFPYVCQLPWYKEPSGFTTDLCAIASDVKVYEKPDLKSKVIGQLNYEVVKVDYEKIEKIKDKLNGVSYYDLTKDWYYIIKYKEKVEGFVQSKDLYSMMGYRGKIEKINGKYLITTFASGD